MTTIRKGAALLTAGGACVVISALLPWVSAFGFFSAHLPGYGVAIMLLFGLTGGGLGATGFRGTMPLSVRIVLWVLAGMEVLLLFGLFGVIEAGAGLTAGFVQPAAGFWFALFGVVTTLAGTIVLQLGAARKPRHTAGPVWTATIPAAGPGWQQSAVTAPPSVAWSADGAHWWNGEAWIPSAPSSSTGLQ